MNIPRLRLPRSAEVGLVLAAIMTGIVGALTHWAIPVVCIAILIFSVLLLNQPVMGLFFIALFLPFERIGSVDVAGVTIRIHQLLALITLVLWGIHGLLRRQWEIAISAAYIPLIAFFACASLGLIYAPNFERSLMLTLFTLFTVIAGMFLPSLLKNTDQLKKLVTFIFIGAVIASIFGLFQYFGDIAGLPTEITGLREHYTKDVLGFPRVQSFTLEPLYFANYLFLPLFVALALLLSKQRVFPRWQLISIAVLFSVNLFLTVSRGAYIGAAVGIAFLALIYLRRLFNPIVGVVIAGVGAIAVFIGARLMEVERVMDKFLGHTLNILSGASYFERVATFEMAIEYWRAHPWFGFGIGSFGPLASHHPFHAPDGGWLIVNNEYLELLVETGVLGLMCFGIFIIVLLWQAFGSAKKMDELFVQAVSYGLMAGLIATLVQYNTFSVLYIMHIWITIGLLHRLTTHCINP